MVILIKALQLILSLSILVLIHELGHFAFARIFKTRVDKFYLFFNPWFSLFKIKLGDTTYGLGWLPVGGYCKIAGMIDESMDKEQLSKPPQPWEFRTKPAYQRFFMMFGGVLFNFILAMLLYSMILMAWGEQYLSAKNVDGGIYCDSLALAAGLQHGDMVEKVGDKTVEKFNDILMFLIIDNEKTITLVRDGVRMTIPIHDSIKAKLVASNSQAFVMPFLPFYVDSVLPKTPAMKAGIRKGDHIVSLNGTRTPAFFDFVAEVRKHKSRMVSVGVVRNGRDTTLRLTVNDMGQIGVAVMGYDKVYKMTEVRYSFVESIPAGIALGVETLGSYVKQMRLMFTAEGAQNIGGFGSIGSMFPAMWDWEIFWRMTAFLSIVLAFMNILPIPGLDGGHIAFLVYEMVSGKKPGERFYEMATMAGLILLFALLFYANANDVLKLFGQ